MIVSLILLVAFGADFCKYSKAVLILCGPVDVVSGTFEFQFRLETETIDKN